MKKKIKSTVIVPSDIPAQTIDSRAADDFEEGGDYDEGMPIQEQVSGGKFHNGIIKIGKIKDLVLTNDPTNSKFSILAHRTFADYDWTEPAVYKEARENRCQGLRYCAYPDWKVAQTYNYDFYLDPRQVENRSYAFKIIKAMTEDPDVNLEALCPDFYLNKSNHWKFATIVTLDDEEWLAFVICRQMGTQKAELRHRPQVCILCGPYWKGFLKSIQEHSLSKSVTSVMGLWNRVQEVGILGITLRNCQEWMGKSTVAQKVSKPCRWRTVSPLISPGPHSHYQIDCIKFGMTPRLPLINPLNPNGSKKTKAQITAQRNKLRLEIAKQSEKMWGSSEPELDALIMTDIFTKKAWGFPLKDMTAQTCWAAIKPVLESEYRHHEAVRLVDPVFVGIEQIIQSDNGSNFRGDFTDELSKITVDGNSPHFKQVYSAPYHPWANGCVERLGKTIKERLKFAILSGYVEFDQSGQLKQGEKIDFAYLLSEAVEWVNSNTHTTINMAPNYVHDHKDIESDHYRDIICHLQNMYHARALKFKAPVGMKRQADVGDLV